MLENLLSRDTDSNSNLPGILILPCLIQDFKNLIFVLAVIILRDRGGKNNWVEYIYVLLGIDIFLL